MRPVLIIFLISLVCLPVVPQSRRNRNYSESSIQTENIEPAPNNQRRQAETDKYDEVIRVKTDLITIPVRISTRNGRAVTDLKQAEFKIFENGIEQEIAYFADEDTPFTVALMLDMSYSSVFKLRDIQVAADLFLAQLREDDRVMIVAFDEKVRVLCKPTTDRRALRLAIEAARIGSGTSVYAALDSVVNNYFRDIQGRKAVILLSDGVDTSSKVASAVSVLRDFSEVETLVFPIRYNTFDDVQKNRQKNAPILYDENDRPYVATLPPGSGERAEDYEQANRFLSAIADVTGGRVYKASGNAGLNRAFADIAAELRKTYSLGYYPSVERRPGEIYSIRVRVYRPDLILRAREKFTEPRRGESSADRP